MTPLMLVDGHHLLYRSWWGFSPRRIMSRDRQSDLTGVFGFLAILRKTHLEQMPDHAIVVIFDGEYAADAKQGLDDTYKANRAEADHTPIKSLGSVKTAITHLGIHWVELEAYEADDVMATVATSATAMGRQVTCYSGDRDLFQLLDDPNVAIVDPRRKRITAQDIEDRYYVTPRQWPDYRALTGDLADNIPGVHGIGPKTASSLLEGGIHLEDLPQTTRLQTRRCENVSEQWPQVLNWRELIRLNHDVPLPDAELPQEQTPPLPKAAEVLEELDLW